MHNKFSYTEYKDIILLIQANLPILDYKEVSKATERFCVIRHDVEFSVDRAFNLALIEQDLGIQTSYMFQIRNNCYNTFSDINLKKINAIADMGHHIGLHAHMSGLRNINNINLYIQNDIKILSSLLGLKINRFSFHRPKKDHLEKNVNIPNVINTYNEKYFHLTNNLKNLNITYLADSQHKWNYGYPADLDFTKTNKLQLLTHPYSWSKKGLDNKENFRVLLSEKDKELRNSINNECKNFSL